MSTYQVLSPEQEQSLRERLLAASYPRACPMYSLELDQFPPAGPMSEAAEYVEEQQIVGPQYFVRNVNI